MNLSNTLFAFISKSFSGLLFSFVYQLGCFELQVKPNLYWFKQGNWYFRSGAHGSGYWGSSFSPSLQRWCHAKPGLSHNLVAWRWHQGRCTPSKIPSRTFFLRVKRNFSRSIHHTFPSVSLSMEFAVAYNTGLFLAHRTCSVWLAALLPPVISVPDPDWKSSPHPGCCQNHPWPYIYWSTWSSRSSLTPVEGKYILSSREGQQILWIIIDGQFLQPKLGYIWLEPATSKWVDINLMPRHVPWDEVSLPRSFAATQLGKGCWGLNHDVPYTWHSRSLMPFFQPDCP